jgi:hypothetical protein
LIVVIFLFLTTILSSFSTLADCLIFRVHYSLKKIENVKEDDEVLSYNEQTGQNEYQQVLQTFERFADDVLSVKIENESEPIGVTSEHPFFVKVHGARSNLSSEDGEWIKTGELQTGDEILKTDGTWATVKSVGSRNNSKVYNFEVRQKHNYFVGNSGVLVHNQTGPTFIVDQGGVVFPVPQGATGLVPVINSASVQTGVAFTGGNGGTNGQVASMRLMDSPSGKYGSLYPNGYIKYENASGQGVNPYSGKTVSRADAHFACK